MFQGSADLIVNPKGNLKVFKTIGSTDKTFYMFNGLYHECLNEPEKEVGYYFEFILTHSRSANPRNGPELVLRALTNQGHCCK